MSVQFSLIDVYSFCHFDIKFRGAYLILTGVFLFSESLSFSFQYVNSDRTYV